MSNLCYIGNGRSIQNSYSKIQNRSLTFKKVELHSFSGNELNNIDSLFVKLIEVNPKVIIIDSNVLPKNKEKKMGVLRLLKVHPRLKGVSLILRFENKQDRLKNYDLLLMGISYSTLSGADINDFFAEIGYLFFEVKSLGLQHASAKGLNLPLRVFHPVAIKELSLDDFVCASWIKMKEKAIYSGVISDERCTHIIPFMLREQKVVTPSDFYEYLNTIYPVDANESALKTDSLDRLKEIFQLPTITSRKDRLLIIEHDFKHFPSYSLKLASAEIAFRMLSYNVDQLEMIKSYKPQLILINVMAEIDENQEDINFKEEENLCYQAFEEMMNHLIEIVQTDANYKPQILIFDCAKMTSLELREKFKYKFIVSSEQKITLNILDQIISRFQNFSSEKSNDGIYYLPCFETANLLLSFYINIVSFSESLVQFSSSLEFSYMTRIEIRFPVIMDLLIIPFEKEPEKQEGDEKLYLALVLNLDENDRMEIRKIVNILIPLDKNLRTQHGFKSSEELARIRDDYMESLLEERRRLQKEQIEKAEEEKRKKEEEEKKAEQEENED